VCLDLGKLEGKKKNWKVVFFHCLVWGKSKGKNREKNFKENLSCYEEIFFPSKYGRKMKEKFVLNRLSKRKIN